MFRGVIPILQTPFDDTGELDLESLARETTAVCEAGAAGVAFPGFVSEWWKLAEGEILEAAAAVGESARGRAAVIFNVTAQSTWLAVRQARAFADLGCDGLMCLPPFIGGVSPAAALRHLEAVIDAAPAPFIMQYSASLTGVRFTPDQLAGLRARHPHFCSIKVDFIPPGPTITELRQALGEDEFTYLIGYSGLQLVDALRRGAHGLMGGAGHVAEDVAVFRALEQDFDAGAAAFRRLLPLLNLEMQTVDLATAVHKRLLKRQGVIASEHVRQPGTTLDDFQSREIEDHLRHLEARGA